jgi:polyhydroxybutyrate depolymerase
MDIAGGARPIEARSSGRSRVVGIAGAAAGLLLAGAAGCGGDGVDNGAPDPSDAAPTSAAPDADEPGCEDRTLDDRRYVLCVTDSGSDQGLVVALHGRGSSADEMRTVTQLDRHAAEAGLAVVYPDALDGGWGDDTFPSPTRPIGDEDVVFLDALVRGLRADPRIDDEPIGVVGFSNGASMALRFASEHPDDVRAVVSIAGQLPRDPAIRPSDRVPLLEVYGTADPVRPYDVGVQETPARGRGDPTPTLPTPDTVAAFVGAGRDASGDAAQVVVTDLDSTDGTRVRAERWADRDGTVAVLQSIIGGAHTWPSSSGEVTGGENFGTTSREIDASAEAIAFVLDPEARGRVAAG